jgi:hypothetical protein
VIAEEGLAELRETLAVAYRIAQDLQDLQDQDVDLGDNVGDMHSVRLDLWSAIARVDGQKEAMAR